MILREIPGDVFDKSSVQGLHYREVIVIRLLLWPGDSISIVFLE